MSPLYSDAIFWIEVDKIRPNPYQPRREFDQKKLEDLAESIRQYGVLQPLVVTRHETQTDDGGLDVEYELIAGERRLRASRIADVQQVPVVIRTGEQDNKLKLELAIIENLQREDLNPVDRARAFQRFIDDFGYTHNAIAKKMGKSREYVSNSLRLLALPEEILDALSGGRITEGHARPLMMLRDKPEEQMTVFKEIVMKKLTVREAEGIARRIATDKIRKKSRDYDPEILEIEKNLTENLGTRVHIEPKEVGGKIMIDFFNEDDLRKLMETLKGSIAMAGANARFSGKDDGEPEESSSEESHDAVEDRENDNDETNDETEVSFDAPSETPETENGEEAPLQETESEHTEAPVIHDHSEGSDNTDGVDVPIRTTSDEREQQDDAEMAEGESESESSSEMPQDEPREPVGEESAEVHTPGEDAFDAMIEGETNVGLEESPAPAANGEETQKDNTEVRNEEETPMWGMEKEENEERDQHKAPQMPVPPPAPQTPDQSAAPQKPRNDADDEDLYAVRNFSL